MSDPTLTFSAADGSILVATGSWTAPTAPLLERQMAALAKGAPLPQGVTIDVSRIEQLDTLGAWLLERLVRQYRSGRNEPVLIGIPDHFLGLLEKVA